MQSISKVVEKYGRSFLYHRMKCFCKVKDAISYDIKMLREDAQLTNWKFCYAIVRAQSVAGDTLFDGGMNHEICFL